MLFALWWQLPPLAPHSNCTVDDPVKTSEHLAQQLNCFSFGAGRRKAAWELLSKTPGKELNYGELLVPILDAPRSGYKIQKSTV